MYLCVYVQAFLYLYLLCTWTSVFVCVLCVCVCVCCVCVCCVCVLAVQCRGGAISCDSCNQATDQKSIPTRLSDHRVDEDFNVFITIIITIIVTTIVTIILIIRTFSRKLRPPLMVALLFYNIHIILDPVCKCALYMLVIYFSDSEMKIVLAGWRLFRS